MANYHPDTEMLIEFSAGSLPAATAVCVATHLEYCVQCRSQVAKFTHIGGSLLAQAEPAALAESAHKCHSADYTATDSALDQALAAIDKLPPCEAPYAASAPSDDKPFPAALKQLLPSRLEELSWRKISASLSIAQLFPGDSQRELALHKLRSGGGVADHDHCGEEITVVIQGSFSDQNGLYTPGDFLVHQPGEAHSPIASNDGDCICLSAMAAPVKFTGFFTRLINPFLKISPSG